MLENTGKMLQRGELIAQAAFFRLKARQKEEEVLAPLGVEVEDSEEEEESEYETDSEEEGYGGQLMKPVFVPKVRSSVGTSPSSVASFESCMGQEAELSQGHTQA